MIRAAVLVYVCDDGRIYAEGTTLTYIPRSDLETACTDQDVREAVVEWLKAALGS
jgi:hypothetical protein